MKKKKINKKLPKYEFGTFKKLPAGYQQANSLGDSTFSTQPGAYNIDTYTKTARKTMLPDTISNIIGSAKYPLQAAFNTTKIAAGTSLSGASAINAAGGIQSVINNGGIPTVGGALNEAGLPTQIGATTGKTSHVLNAAGKSASILGLGYSVGDALFNTIPGASQHRTASDMDDTISRSTYTTAGGNTYTTYGNPDLQGELEYGKQQATKNRLGLASDVAGAVSSALALSGFGAPLSLISYPLAFAATFGLGSLFGFGDNSDEIEHEARKLADVNAGRNRMNQSVAESKDIEMGRAANGKMPGFHNGKSNARVSNGEVIGNFKDGYFRVPGGKNNEDNVKTHLGKQDFVISNKHGLSDYAWLTGDIPGALAAQSYLQKTGQMNKYKNGRLPKYEGGRWSDAVFSMIPHGISLASNIAQYNRAKNADIYAPDFYVENPEGAKAVNTLASLRFDADPYYREAQRGLNQANWDARRLVGLGIGGRAIMQNANYAQYLNGLRDITKMYNEANNTYKEKYANALANLGATNQGRRMQANAQRHQLLQQANAARENWMAQYRKNIDQNLLNAASEYMKWGQYNDSLGIQNKMLELYDRQAKIDELKANAYINSLGGNKTHTNTSAGIPLSYMTNMAKTPLTKYGFTPSLIAAMNRIPNITNV